MQSALPNTSHVTEAQFTRCYLPRCERQASLYILREAPQLSILTPHFYISERSLRFNRFFWLFFVLTMVLFLMFSFVWFLKDYSLPVHNCNGRLSPRRPTPTLTPTHTSGPCTRRIRWIARAQATQPEGREFESKPRQTNDLSNWYLPLSSLALGINRIGQRLVSVVWFPREATL